MFNLCAVHPKHFVELEVVYTALFTQVRIRIQGVGRVHVANLAILHSDLTRRRKGADHLKVNALLLNTSYTMSLDPP